MNLDTNIPFRRLNDLKNSTNELASQSFAEIQRVSGKIVPESLKKQLSVDEIRDSLAEVIRSK